MDSLDLNEDYIYLINNLGQVESIHHSRIKILGLSNYFELDVLDENFVFGLIYIQETLNRDRMVALIPRKLIIQINERLSWNNEDEDVRIFTILNLDQDISEKDLGNIYDDVDFKKICPDSGVCKKDYFKKICRDSGVCIALAQYAKQIEDYFLGFTDFTYVSSGEKIPTSSANGFVHKILYDREGYTAQSVLKSSKKESADNLLYEYLVGQYINKKCDIFPCFIRTYGWFKYNSPADWEKMKDSTDITSFDLRDCMTKDDDLFETITQSKEKNCVDDKKNPLSIRRECTALEYLLGFSCKNSKYLSVLIEHINSITLTMMAFSNKEFIINNEILYVLYQVYMPLSTLRDEFTHYDLHTGNVLVYEPDRRKYIDYIYKLKNGEIIRFKSKYIAKIIDYGRSYFNDPSNQDISGSSKRIYDNICNNVIDCGDIGYDYGFLEMSKYSNRNVSKDLSLTAQVKKFIQTYRSPQNTSLLESLNKVDLASTYGAPEKYDNTGTGKIENMSDIHNELKELVLQNKTKNEKEYKEFTSLGSLTIYETGKPMKFIPYNY
jgi:hypothetical protein